MYKIYFYVPASHLTAVKNAMFAAGAGKLGGYEHCAWQTLGEGQYRPLAGSQPYSGVIDELCVEPEYKVEMVCSDDVVPTVIAAMKKAHPYEVPAYGVWQLDKL